MHTLSFDVETAKAELTQIFRDRLAAQGSVYNVGNVDIEDVDFNGIPQPVPGQAQLVADMKTDLAAAQANGQRWFNDVQPHLTVIPQAAINYGSKWNVTIPLVLQQLRQSAPDRAVLQALFQGLRDSIDEQTQTLGALMQSLASIRAAAAADAGNFSSKHAPFQQLEDLDKDNLAKARTTLAGIQAMIDQFNEQIDVDTIKAEKDLSIASNAMKYGGKFGKPGKIVGLTIGLIFIVSATFAIDDLIATVAKRLAEAEEAGEYELEMSLLTTQLVSLDTASSALASLVNELDDMIASLQGALDGWKSEADALSAIVTDLQGSAPVDGIINQFDLGKTQAQWDELSTFAMKWQSMEIASKAANDLVVGGAATEPASLARV